MRLANWIDPFARADAPPPKHLMAFIRWSLDGSWPALGAAAVISVLAGILEVMAALILGWVIDAALASDPA